MSQHDEPAPSADWVSQDMVQVVRECRARLESQDEQLRRLGNATLAVEAERKVTSDNLDKAQHVLDTLRSAALEGQQLRAALGQFLSPHLRVVPDTEDPSAAQAPPQGAPATSEGCASEAVALPAGNPVVRIGGERSVIIMKVISTDGQRHWSVRDVTEALGETPDAVRRNRSVLETLCNRGVLARREGPGSAMPGKKKKKVFYQLAAPWQAA